MTSSPLGIRRLDGGGRGKVPAVSLAVKPTLEPDAFKSNAPKTRSSPDLIRGCRSTVLRAASDQRAHRRTALRQAQGERVNVKSLHRSEEHTSELQSLMRISYAVFCLKKKNKKNLN